MSLYMGEDKITPILLSEAPTTVVEEKDVNFYDYDGTLLYSYTKNEFLALNELPANPTHTGLVAQGWNWDLADAKTYVTDYGILDIGQVYTTASGLSEFDIELTNTTGLTVNLMMDGTKNWGDGTSDTLTTHTYSTAGEYTITCNGTTITPSSSTYNICNNTSVNFYIKSVRITNIASITNYSFAYLRNLNTITISNETTTIGTFVFSGDIYLKHITLPKNFKKIQSSFASGCSNLKSISFPKDAYFDSNQSNTFSDCYNLKRILIFNTYLATGKTYPQSCCQSAYNLEHIIFSKYITTISKLTFSNASNIKKYDFTKKKGTVPTLSNTSAFDNINSLFTKIVVPDSLYPTWIAASNWVTYADYIVKESDYSGS